MDNGNKYQRHNCLSVRPPSSCWPLMRTMYDGSNSLLEVDRKTTGLDVSFCRILLRYRPQPEARRNAGHRNPYPSMK